MSPRDGASAPSTTPTHSPAQAAAVSGFSLDTLRYYERQGLLPAVSRNGAGRRCYSERDLGWLALVRCLRETGMSIAQTRCFIDAVHTGDDPTDRLAILEAHDHQIDQQVAALRLQQDFLRTKISDYQRRGPTPDPRLKGSEHAG